MAAKDSKKTSPGIIGPILAKALAGQTLIEVDKLDELMENKKWIMVIIWDTILDQALKKLLSDLHFVGQDKELKKLFEPSIGGPLVSLTHKARLAYALGLINKTVLKDLEQIHKIRNKFAHAVKMNFADTEVAKLVGKLSSTAKKQKITARNSYNIYRGATAKCWVYLTEAMKQEQYRQAVVMMAKKEKKENKTEKHRGKNTKMKK